MLTQREVAALKVGDEVGVSGIYAYEAPFLEKVTSVLKTQIVVGTRRFNLQGRQIYVQHRYEARYLLTREECQRRIAYKAEEAANLAAVGKLEQFRWRDLNTGQAQRVLELLSLFAVEAKAEREADPNYGKSL